jgi:uncharacterized protein YdiU (UPF0061 family)
VNPAARRDAMLRTNPKYIPRNHRVEQAIAAANTGDFGPFERLMAVLAAPFDDQPENSAYANPPEAHEVVARTFCGT